MRVGIGLIVATALLVSVPAPAEIYRWVDERGVTHLDDTLANVPEAKQPDAKVFHTKAAAPATTSESGSTQNGFANQLARELGLIATGTQDAVSALHIVGVYPSSGWNPTATLTPAIVDEVTRAARAAARGRRLPQGEASVEATVLRVASSLGVAGPPPTVVAEPAPAPPTIVVAPNIVVEPPPPTVVVHTIERRSEPILTGYGYNTGFGTGVLFTPSRRRRGPEPVPDRIPPLWNPAGRLHGPAVPPRPDLAPFPHRADF